MIVKDHVIRYIELIKPNMINTYGERRLPSGIIREGNILEKETFKMILEECIEKWNIKGAKLSFCVPDALNVIRRTTVSSQIPNDEVKGEMYFELGEKFHLPFENPILEVSVVGETEQEKEVIIVASPEKVVNDYQSIFKEVKLKPIVADVSSLSLYRLFHSLDLANHVDHFLFVQINMDSINMTVFHRDKPLFTRHIRRAIDEELWELTTNRLGIIDWTFIGEHQQLEGQIHDFSIELDRIMNFYHFSLHKGNEKVTKVVITGDHPYLDSYMEKCNNTIHVPIINIPESICKTQNNREIPTRFHEAIGLSMHSQLY